MSLDKDYNELEYRFDCAADIIYSAPYLSSYRNKHHPEIMKRIKEYEDSVNMPEEDRYSNRLNRPEYKEMAEEFSNTLETLEENIRNILFRTENKIED